MRLFSGLLGSLEEREADTHPRFSERRREALWNGKLTECRRACAKSVESMADILYAGAECANLDLIRDPASVRAMRRMLRRKGILLEEARIRLLARDRIGLEVSLKSRKGSSVAAADIPLWLSEELGRQMQSDTDNPPGVGASAQRFCFFEKPRFHTTYGVARAGKRFSSVSGDSFSYMDLKNGWQMAAVSDGMGFGESARIESERVIDMLEEFLRIGLAPEDAVGLINDAIVLGRSRVCFSTLDLHLWNVYTGRCRSFKAGASVTLLKRGGEIRRLYSDTLPVGAVPELKIAAQEMQLQNGDFLILLTDGVADALPASEQEFLLDGIVRGAHTGNPEELARHILKQTLAWRGGDPKDDMLVMATGFWEDP